MRPTAPLALCLAACSVAPTEPRAAPPYYEIVARPDTGLQARRGEDAHAMWSPPGTVFVTNRGNVSFLWRLEASVPWLAHVGPPGGMLAPSGSVRIEPSIDAVSAPTTPGWHDAELRVLNAMTFHCEVRIPVRWIVDGTVSGPPEPSIGALTPAPSPSADDARWRAAAAPRTAAPAPDSGAPGAAAPARADAPTPDR